MEQGRKSITTVQAGIILCLVINLNGLTKVGNVYLANAIAMAQDLGLFAPYPASISEKCRKVQVITAWSLFSWQA
jgi:hypothetical protein